jgi:hypothetical protein
MAEEPFACDGGEAQVRLCSAVATRQRTLSPHRPEGQPSQREGQPSQREGQPSQREGQPSQRACRGQRSHLVIDRIDAPYHRKELRQLRVLVWLARRVKHRSVAAQS